MSYDIYIGEAVLDVPDAEDVEKYGSTELRVRVAGFAHPEAPSFPNDAMTENGNSRHPGYSQWHDFTKRVGFEALWYDDEDGLLRPHPGTRLLISGHLLMVDQALERHVAKHGEIAPGWCACSVCGQGFGDGEHDPSMILYHSGDRARLLWLQWWMRWALANCKVPAIHNH